MKLNVLKSLLFLFLLQYGIGCSNCRGKKGYKDVKAGELRIRNYNLFKNNNVLSEQNVYSRKDDTLLLLLAVIPNYITEKVSNSGLLYACDISVPILNPNIDSVSIITLSDFDNIKKVNANINDYCRTIKSIYDSSSYKNQIFPLKDLRKLDTYPGVILVNKPITDSVKLRITYFLEGGETRSTNTKWLRFN